MALSVLADTGSGSTAGALLVIIILAGVLYFLPSIVAVSRGVNVGTVIVLNLFLGWTLIGWVVSLAMAAGSRDRGVVIHQNYGQPPGYGSPQGMPPGWYQDPWRQAAQRYWNGAGWTDQLA